MRPTSSLHGPKAIAVLLAVLAVGALAGALATRVLLDEPTASTAAPDPEPAPAEVAARESSAPAEDAPPAARVVADLSEPGDTDKDHSTDSREASTASTIASAAGRPSPGPSRDLERLLDGLERVEEGLARLQSRVRALEGGIAGTPQPASLPDLDPAPAQTPADRRAALRSAGVAEEVAAEIVWLQGQQELGRLELRDLALREGWFGTDRYREELERLSEQDPDLRAELGDEAYDRYLYAAGENNRIRVEGVIAGSVAEEIGLQPGDLIETYDGERVFTFGELRQATSEGTRDELVDIKIRRADGGVVQSLVPRGPLGVRLDADRARPEG